jgi:hypothetical protein
VHLKRGLTKNFVKAMNHEEADFTYLREKWKKVFSLVHKYETLSRTNNSTSSFKRTKGDLGQFRICSKKVFGEPKGTYVWGASKQRFAELSEIRLQHVTKNTLPSYAFGFLPIELWCTEWWTLLMGYGNGCTYRGMHATGKTKENTWFCLC